jgi:HD superfamily phosphohydrolase
MDQKQTQDSAQGVCGVTRCKKAGRIVQDTVWGRVQLPPWLWVLVDTPTVQRLRFLRQTGWLNLLFPCAEHSRFPHSLGVAHVAGNLLKCLADAQPELAITPAEAATVVVAALCHDLGHGPFSHSFEKFMTAVGRPWCHETQTVTMVRHMVASSPAVAAVLEAQGVDVHAVCEMVMGSPEHAPEGWHWRGPPAGRQFLYQVVSNAVCGVDVDRIDYLNRDFQATGVACAAPPDAARTLAMARVVGGDLAWPVSEAATVGQVFRARQELHRLAFQHPVARATELMVVQAMVAMQEAGTVVDPETGCTLADLVGSPDTFLRGTDTVILAAMQGLCHGVPRRAATLFRAVLTRNLWRLHSETFVGSLAEADRVVAAVPADPPPAAVDVVYVHRGAGSVEPLKLVPWFSAASAADDGSLEVLTRSHPKDMDCAFAVMDQGVPGFYAVRVYRE